MIRIEIPDLDELIRHMPTEDKARRAMAESVNRALIAGRKTAVDAVKAEYTAKFGAIKNYTHISRASASNPSGSVVFGGPMTSLKRFKISPKKRPKRPPRRQMKVAVKHGSNATYTGAFVGPNDHVFRRLGVPSSSNPRKEAIGIVYGPSIAHLLNKESTKQSVQERSMQILRTRLTHHINRMTT